MAILAGADVPVLSVIIHAGASVDISLTGLPEGSVLAFATSYTVSPVIELWSGVATVDGDISTWSLSAEMTSALATGGARHVHVMHGEELLMAGTASILTTWQPTSSTLGQMPDIRARA